MSEKTMLKEIAEIAENGMLIVTVIYDRVNDNCAKINPGQIRSVYILVARMIHFAPFRYCGKVISASGASNIFMFAALFVLNFRF